MDHPFQRPDIDHIPDTNQIFHQEQEQASNPNDESLDIDFIANLDPQDYSLTQSQILATQSDPTFDKQVAEQVFQSPIHIERADAPRPQPQVLYDPSLDTGSPLKTPIAPTYDSSPDLPTPNFNLSNFEPATPLPSIDLHKQHFDIPSPLETPIQTRNQVHFQPDLTFDMSENNTPEQPKDSPVEQQPQEEQPKQEPQPETQPESQPETEQENKVTIDPAAENSNSTESTAFSSTPWKQGNNPNNPMDESLAMSPITKEPEENQVQPQVKTPPTTVTRPEAPQEENNDTETTENKDNKSPEMLSSLPVSQDTAELIAKYTKQPATQPIDDSPSGQPKRLMFSNNESNATQEPSTPTNGSNGSNGSNGKFADIPELSEKTKELLAKYAPGSPSLQKTTNQSSSPYGAYLPKNRSSPRSPYSNSSTAVLLAKYTQGGANSTQSPYQQRSFNQSSRMPASTTSSARESPSMVASRIQAKYGIKTSSSPRAGPSAYTSYPSGSSSPSSVSSVHRDYNMPSGSGSTSSYLPSNYSRTSQSSASSTINQIAAKYGIQSSISPNTTGSTASSASSYTSKYGSSGLSGSSTSSGFDYQSVAAQYRPSSSPSTSTSSYTSKYGTGSSSYGSSTTSSYTPSYGSTTSSYTPSYTSTSTYQPTTTRSPAFQSTSKFSPKSSPFTLSGGSSSSSYTSKYGSGSFTSNFSSNYGSSGASSNYGSSGASSNYGSSSGSYPSSFSTNPYSLSKK